MTQSHFEVSNLGQGRPQNLPILCSCAVACDRADQPLQTRKLLGEIAEIQIDHLMAGKSDCPLPTSDRAFEGV